MLVLFFILIRFLQLLFQEATHLMIFEKIVRRNLLRLISEKSTVCLILTSLLFVNCSVQKVALAKFTDALTSEDNNAFTGDDDQLLVKDALPFTMKLYESLAARDSLNDKLLLATGKLFCLYAQAFVLFPSDTLPDSLATVKKAAGKRAKKLFLRGRDYCLKGLDIRHKGLENVIKRGPIDSSLTITKEADSSFLYWISAGWLGAIASDRSDIGLALTIKRPLALMSRLTALDSNYGMGAAHELFCTVYATLPKSLGGSESKAREEFSKAVALSGDHKTSTYVTLATSVSLKKGDRKEFTDLLVKAESINADADGKLRLINTIYQQRARWLLNNIDKLIPEKTETPDSN